MQVTSCNTKRVTEVVELIKKESTEESFFELVNFLELPHYDCTSTSIKDGFLGYFHCWLDDSPKQAVTQLLFHLKRLGFKEDYSNL